MMKHTILALAAVGFALGLTGCGCDDNTPFWYDGITSDSTSEWGWDVPYDGTGDGTLTDTPIAGFGTITGRVTSPQSPVGSFGISGALVYVTKTEPAPIDEGVYCHECVEMPSTIPHAFSAADGTFTIHGISEGSWMLVVRKGEFRKVRYIDVTADMTLDVPWEFTTFPNAHHPDAGDNTPSIAVALGSFDDMQDILAKIGLCDLDTDSHAINSTCDHIDFYDNGGGYDGEPGFETLLQNPTQMASYHIIFVPCSSSGNDSYLSDPTVLANIRNWVDLGGKWYVADWSYDWVEQVFPEFLDFEGDDSSTGAADSASGSFDSTGRAVNDDLRAWVEMSLGHSPDSIEFAENWDCIAGLGTVPGTDPDGMPISITPEIYTEGPITRTHDCMDPVAPLTMTFPYGCGKVLFTTYHTVGEMSSSHADLLIQEQILVYMILEIGLCTEPVVII